jgi:transposase
VHWHAGRSKNEIAGSLGLSRNTVRKYVAAAEAAGMVPGGAAVSQERWAELARGWFPELADTRLRQVTWPAIAGHRDYIVEQLAAGVTVATIHQRLADERGLAVSVASLRRDRERLRLFGDYLDDELIWQRFLADLEADPGRYYPAGFPGDLTAAPR